MHCPRRTPPLGALLTLCTVCGSVAQEEQNAALLRAKILQEEQYQRLCAERALFIPRMPMPPTSFSKFVHNFKEAGSREVRARLPMYVAI